MKSIKRLISWQISLLCLLACLCASTLRPVGAQSEQPQAEELPGIPAGYTIIEGDIQVPTSVANEMRNPAKRQTPEATFTTALWPNGVVPYRFETTCRTTSTCSGAPQSGCVSAANQATMISAMGVIEAVSNVRFQRCANDDCGRGDPSHILVRDSTNDTTAGAGNTCQNAARNNSPVGRQGGGQIINITSWGTQFIIVHELLHSLGFFHEHTRPDRDNFVNVSGLCANVQGGCMGSTFLNNFPIASGATTYGPYDFDSVMHYGQCSFSNGSNCPADGLITVQVLAPFNTQNSPDGVPWQNAIGQRQRLSELDRLTVSFLYPRPEWRFVNASYAGGNGAPDGSFFRPYQSLVAGISATPVGGVLWLQPGTYFVNGPLTKAITLRAPLGNVNIRRN